MELITVFIYASIYIGIVATTFYILSFFAYQKKERLMYTDNELPKVTVLIPAYNEEDSIERTIKSVSASNYPRNKFEILVIDDGSKDKTLEIAKRFETKGSVVKVFHKQNGGKGTALNYGIKKAKGEIIFTMDADTSVPPESLKNMVRYFKDEKIMPVTPSMVIARPKTIWQRIQHVEYLQGLFLRKAFASINSIYITPGAFSAYRKSFFERYGGYDEGNITEDLEMSLKIQFNGYRIENCSEAPAYTIAPEKFRELLIQRRRWYFGLLKNTWKYKKIFGKKYGDLGTFVLPIGWISIFFSLIIAIFSFFKTISKVKDEFLYLQSINYSFSNTFDLNAYFIERFLFLFFSNPIILFIILFLVLLGMYIRYGVKKIGGSPGLMINLPLYFLTFSILFSIWWIVSIFYALFSKTVKWR